MDGKLLLSGPFAEMTARISALNEKKEELKQELKAYHEKVKAEIVDLEQEAADIYTDYESTLK